ncbi:hypothetical protein C4546_00310 [Candidatus Parcubacteria bacterium]|jgi:hypothetical protein|nr:MAG: hypothetical protein C4546_00310 [Candidatus Parcubacteria bacterium]
MKDISFGRLRFSGMCYCARCGKETFSDGRTYGQGGGYCPECEKKRDEEFVKSMLAKPIVFEIGASSVKMTPDEYAKVMRRSIKYPFRG